MKLSPPDDDPARDENSVDSEGPEVGPEPGDGERQAKPDDDLAQDDELRAGQYGPTADNS